MNIIKSIGSNFSIFTSQIEKTVYNLTTCCHALWLLVVIITLNMADNRSLHLVSYSSSSDSSGSEETPPVIKKYKEKYP